ncbi:26889_t:CDS:2, partial [Racocetra persica]
LPKGSAGHPLGPLWQAFNPVKTNNDKKPKASCMFCNPAKPIFGTAAVMLSHIKKFQSMHDMHDIYSNCGSISDLSECSNKKFSQDTNQISMQLPIDTCESQTSIVILRDLEEVLTQIDGAANYVHIKTILIQKYPKIIALLCIAHESNLLVESQHTTLADAVYLWAQTQMNTNIIDDNNFQFYINT